MKQTGKAFKEVSFIPGSDRILYLWVGQTSRDWDNEDMIWKTFEPEYL